MSHFRLSGLFAAPFAVSIALLALAGCRGGNGGQTDTIQVAGARQLAVGDEPFAVNAAVSVLAQGGNAVDAATALFFALSVTYPVAAGPGGGGLCIARDPSGVVGEFDFLPRAANRGGAYGVPMAVRGFYDMQKRLGSMPWQRTVSPAEAMADVGFPMSQALATRLRGTENIIRLDAALAAEFLDQSGQLKKAGTTLTNPALARTLSVIRQEGADGFAAKIGGSLIAYAAGQGGALGPDDFAAARTRQVAPSRRVVGGMNVSYPAVGTGAGAFSNSLLSRAAASTPANAAANALAAVRQALAGFGVASVPADFGSTAFAVTDGTGGTVACAVTMNGPFGSGRTATGTGVVLAASPTGPAGLASAFLMPLLGQGGGNALFAGAAAGGPNGSAALTSVLLRMAGGASVASANDIRTTGAAPRDTINLIACQSACVALPDPGASGLGAAVPAQAPP
ncbi:MAG: gamma-glutamyltransferase [Alphaproteobacteria bacterium]|nr:gamma-glutamyltransferase [Alphaproteobacteria bacterium]